MAAEPSDSGWGPYLPASILSGLVVAIALVAAVLTYVQEQELLWEFLESGRNRTATGLAQYAETDAEKLDIARHWAPKFAWSAFFVLMMIAIFLVPSAQFLPRRWGWAQAFGMIGAVVAILGAALVFIQGKPALYGFLAVMQAVLAFGVIALLLLPRRAP
ncbi:MAG: hypothetical protein ACRDTM_03870 [Micromonosporaceae bacterium]